MKRPRSEPPRRTERQITDADVAKLREAASQGLPTVEIAAADRAALETILRDGREAVLAFEQPMVEAWTRGDVAEARRLVLKDAATAEQYEWKFKRLFVQAYLRAFLPSVFRRPAGRPGSKAPASQFEPPPRSRGRRAALTPDIEAWFLREIDSWKKRLSAEGLPCTDSAALRAAIAHHHIRKLRGQGVPEQDARRIAAAKAKGPTFRTRKVDLSRLRRQGRIRRRKSN